MFKLLIFFLLLAPALSAPLEVAHRGASKEAPENTLPAFELAWKQGADAIEADILLTKDQQIVCIHDTSTKKLADKNLTVKEATLAELKRLDVGYKFSHHFKDTRIPTIAEVFDTIPNGKKIYIEIKCGVEIIPHLLQSIKKSSLKDEQIVIICFKAEVIKNIKSKAPQYKAYWLSHFKLNKKAQRKPTLQTVLQTLKESNADGFSSSHKGISKHFINAVNEAGFEYHVWTINDVERAKQLTDWGARSITTDSPFLIHSHLNSDPVSFSIAAVADVQYADTEPRGNREPREGIKRLRHAVNEWKKRDLDWAVMLGDVIDWDDIDYGKFPKQTILQTPIEWKHTNAVLKVWEQLKCDRYIVLGNHDYYVPYEDTDGLKKPASVFRAFGFKDKAYYDFDYKGFRFVVLDGDISPYNFHPDTEEYKAANIYFNTVKGPQRTPWNAGISNPQLKWLRSVLTKSLQAKEPTVIMCHYPIHHPIGGHSLLNSQELLDLLDQYPNVVLYLNGHNHKGAYKLHGQRHHLNLKGMQCEAENWYQLDFSKDQIKVYQAEDLKKPVYELALHWQSK